MTLPFSSDQTRLVRRNPWVMGLAASPLALAVVDLLVAAVTRQPMWLVVVPHLLGLGVLLPLIAWRKTLWLRELPGE